MQGEFLFAPKLYAGDSEEALVSVAEAIAEYVSRGIAITSPSMYA